MARPLPTAQVPGVYHRRFGGLLVSAVSDGYVDPLLDVVRGVTAAEAERMVLAALGRPGLRIGVNMFAVRSAGRTWLVDAGSGTTMCASPGSRPRTSTPSC